MARDKQVALLLDAYVLGFGRLILTPGSVEECKQVEPHLGTD